MLLSCAGQPTMSEQNDTDIEQQYSYSLDMENHTIRQRIGEELANPTKQKFVQLEIINVVNPNNAAVSFEVYFETKSGERKFLGTFGLFPPDNPGRFIVATKGQLETAGSIIVTIRVLDERTSLDGLRVEMKRISFKES